MWFDSDLLRLRYLPTVLIPVSMALITTNTTIVDVLPQIMGWAFLLIHANLVNDFVDRDRKISLRGKPLFGISLSFLIFGLYLLMNTILYAMGFVLLMSIHNFLTSRRVYSDILVQPIAFLLPYLAIATFIDAKILIFLVLGNVIGMFIDRLIDEKMGKRQFKILRLVTIWSLVGFLISVLYFSVTGYNFLAPFAILILGSFIAVLKRYLSFTTKIAIVYGSNAFLFYLIAVLTSYGNLL